MTGKTHIGAGILSGLALSINMKTNIPDAIIYCAVGSLLSDFDSGKSTISSMFPFIGIIIDALTKHRGILHWGTPIALLFLHWKFGYIFLLFLAIGSASHFVLDLVTKLFNITCNSIGEGMILKLIWITNIFIISNMISPGWYDGVLDIAQEKILAYGGK